MREPAGFFITWTCHGTWLYGDPRGSVDREHSAYGTPYLPGNEKRVSALHREMKQCPIRLTREARTLVEETIEQHCHLRHWELLAVNVRSNHVHVVVRYAGVTPEKMTGEWKSWCTRRLREQGLIAVGQAVWTRHGSTRYVWKERDFDAVVRYVVEGQDAERLGE